MGLLAIGGAEHIFCSQIEWSLEGGCNRQMVLSPGDVSVR